VTVSQVRHVLGERLAMKLLRLMKLSRRRTERQCAFCGKPMLLVNSQEPPLQLDGCSSCNAVWFDAPTYESLPELAFDSTNFRQMQATEIIATQRLREFNEREEEERKKARKKKLWRRTPETGEPPGKPG
jgi:Zn-finger nucleic acid-binding protein